MNDKSDANCTRVNVKQHSSSDATTDNLKSNSGGHSDYNVEGGTGVEELTENNVNNVKLKKNEVYKRLYDINNNKGNILQQQLKKRKTCGVNTTGIQIPDFLKTRYGYNTQQQVLTTVPHEQIIGQKEEENEEEEEEEEIQEEQNNEGETMIMRKGGNGASNFPSSNNQEDIQLLKKKINGNENSNSNSNSNNNNNITNTKIKNILKIKSRKRKRAVAKIDMKFILKCKTCKYINPYGFKVEDYYECQNCGDNDFYVIRSMSPSGFNNNNNNNHNNNNNNTSFE